MLRNTLCVAISALALFSCTTARAQEMQVDTPQVIDAQQPPQNTQFNEKLRAQDAALQTAREASAYIKRSRRTAAAKLIRSAVRNAMADGDDYYQDFINELNTQLESRNVLQTLGLHQRPHAAINTAQYQAELGLYGQRTLPASILSMITPEAIRQGDLNDCWFLSTLAVVADDYPYLIPSMITVNEDASYMVKFPGYPHKVRVKALAQNSSVAVGARSTEYGDWPFVLECAATALYPDDMRQGGHANNALKVLTGIDSDEYSVIPNTGRRTLAGADLRETVVAALETNQSVMIASRSQGPLVKNHEYSVIDVIPANEEHGAWITMRNPWGRLGFDPDTIDPSEITTGEDGRFSMPLATLGKYFDSIVVPKTALRSQSLVSDAAPQNPNNPNLPVVPRSYVVPRNVAPTPAPNNSNGLPRVPRSYIGH